MKLKHCILSAALVGASSVFADLPTAVQVQANMGMGYNIGNTMEVPGNYGGPTGWGNIFPTQAYLDSIKAAGFNTVRIPCAWDSHASNNVINSGWLDSVQTVVDYAMNAGLYTVLNIHWDGGWLQDDDFTSAKSNIVEKQKAYWTQIANRFVNYDEHLLFSGMNEPGLDLSWNASLIPALVSYQQAFIDAVRATGGNNKTRTLIVSGPKTDIDVTCNLYTTMPTDQVSGRLMVEVHYYDPYQYTLMTEEQNWGATESILPQYYYGDYLSTTEIKRNAGYNAWAYAVDDSLASIKHANGQFAKMKRNFIDKGYPVIIGEFGANLHTDVLSGSALTQHKNGRVQWHKDVATAAKNYGLTPILWDMGNESSALDNMCYIRHSTTNASTAGKVVDVDVINAMRNVYGLGNYVNTGIASSSSTIRDDNSSSSVIAYSSSSSDIAFSSSSSVVASEAWQSSSSESVDDLTAIEMKIVLNPSLRLADNVLSSEKEITLFDVNGNLIRHVHVSGASATLSLVSLRQGVYIAKSGSSVLRFRVK